MPPILYTVSGVVLIVYGILTARAQPVNPTAKPRAGGEDDAYFWGGYGLGVGLIFLNPAALITWVVIVGSALAGVTRLEGIAVAIGVGVGSAAWFLLVAYLADHGKRILGKRAIWITRVVGMLLAGYGVFSVGRGIYYYLTRF